MFVQVSQDRVESGRARDSSGNMSRPFSMSSSSSTYKASAFSSSTRGTRGGAHGESALSSFLGQKYPSGYESIGR